MKLIVAAAMAFLLIGCSVSENKPTRDIELFHPQKSVVDTAKVMEEL